MKMEHIINTVTDTDCTPPYLETQVVERLLGTTASLKGKSKRKDKGIGHSERVDSYCISCVSYVFTLDARHIRDTPVYQDIRNGARKR